MPTCYYDFGLSTLLTSAPFFPDSLTITSGSPGTECPCGSAYKLPCVSQVIFDKDSGTTVLIWADGEKTIVHCGEGETFDRYTGFMAAVCKRMFGGTTTAKKLMNSIDKSYQAELKAKEAAMLKAKREEEAKAAQAKADKRREKANKELMDMMVEHFLLEAEAKRRAAEIMAKKDPENYAF